MLTSGGHALLSAESCELLADSVVDLEVLGHTPVDANRLALCQIVLVILGRHALLLTRVRHS